jgi:hypothetical protein
MLWTTRLGFEETVFWEGLNVYFISYETDSREDDASNNSCFVSYVGFAAESCLFSRCLATIRGYTYRHTDRPLLSPLFRFQALVGGYTDTQIDTQTARLPHKLRFTYQNKKNKLQIVNFKYGTHLWRLLCITWALHHHSEGDEYIKCEEKWMNIGGLCVILTPVAFPGFCLDFLAILWYYTSCWCHVAFSHT